MQEEIKEEIVEEEVEQTEEETIEGNEEEQKSEQEVSEQESSKEEEKPKEDEGIELKDTVPTYTKEQMEAIAKRREKRAIEKKDKEYQEKLSKLEYLKNLVQKGTNIEDLNQLTTSLEEQVKKKGIQVSKPTQGTKPVYSDDEESFLAEKDFKETNELGIEEVDNEAKRLYNKGYSNLTTREKVYYGKLCKTLVDNKDLKELKQKGVKPEIIESKEFKELRSKYNGSASEFYEKIYKPLYVKEEKPDNAGSQKGSPISVEKNSYNESEATKLLANMTAEDLAKKPELLEKLKNSMGEW